MIQSSFPVMQNVEPSSGVDSSGETSAFQSWLVRREAARQQIRRLSRRELQVIELVAQGRANKTIAQELSISVKTIEKHRANAARKLGVNSTADLVRITVLADQPQRLLDGRLKAEASVSVADGAEPVLCED